MTAEHNVALRCLPRSEGAFVEALIELDEDYRVVRLLVREAGEVDTEFRFASWQETLTLPDSMFRFVAPPGVAIVDDPGANGGP